MAIQKKRIKSLSTGRPPTARPSMSMSRKSSRTLINKHHQLEKHRLNAESQGDMATASRLAREISNLGGISKYQQASLQGQSSDRGGDSSKILLDWLPADDIKKANGRLKMLEVGALSVKNACSNSGIFDMTRIDLNSQEPGILKQDFMQRPLPQSDMDRFDIISLSLVLNFVPDAAVRGEMLRLTTKFMAKTESLEYSHLFPSLFLVLPRSCVDNSRYFTEERLRGLMHGLGFRDIKRKLTQKLIYTLWVYDEKLMIAKYTLAKKEVNPGRSRNNFVIILK